LTSLEKYEITDRLGFFTLDNANSNDTCLQIFLPHTQPDIADEELKARRLRCFGYILNLAAKAFLFGKNADAFEVEHELYVSLNRELEEREIWRKHGPVGKQHNIVVFISCSPQRKELFARISNLQEPDFAEFQINEDTRNLGLVRDNATRWNSAFLMIERALQRRDEIDSFIARELEKSPSLLSW